MASIRERFRNALTAFRWDGGTRAPHAFGDNLMGGGLVNKLTGMGGTSDKGEHSYFTPTRLYSREPIEIIYNESSAIRKAIDIPVDDALRKWRTFSDAPDSQIEAMEAAERLHMLKAKLRGAMKDGSLYGTAMICMITKEADLMEPLMPERIRMGDLIALRVYNRFSLYVSQRNDDVMSTDYGPAMYHVFPKNGMPFDIHPSRCIRFDGLRPNSDDPYTTYDYDWGVSRIVPMIVSVFQDAGIAKAVNNLIQVASIPVVSVSGLREAILGGGDGDLSPEKVAAEINEKMSVFRLLMLEKGTEEFTRVAVNFGNLDKIQEKARERIAAEADIPMTRFNSRSPGGMNATGESDLENYYQMIASRRDDALSASRFDVLDEVLARDAGLREAPMSEWAELMEPKPSVIAETAKKKAEALKLAVDMGAMDEDEVRVSLDGDEVFGVLEGEAPGMPDPPMPPAPTNGPPNPNAA